VRSLAQASEQEVLKMWEGLGYYSRARHLHTAARYFLEQHDGIIPSQRRDLEKVKGLGPYTIGAILSFAFHQRAPAVDANVARVLARYFCIQEDISKSDIQKKLWQIAEDILPDGEPWVVVEGLIELGATVCMRRAKCDLCPLNKGCMALSNGMQDLIPLKEKNKEIILIKRHVFVIQYGREVLLGKGASGAVMAGLYEFPYCEIGEDPAAHARARFPFTLVFERELKEQTHSFTRYRAQLFPALWKALEKKQIEEYDWVPWEKVQDLPFSSGHRRILINSPLQN
jgi:A/G-specific adenine glycosylase